MTNVIDHRLAASRSVGKLTRRWAKISTSPPRLFFPKQVSRDSIRDVRLHYRYNSVMNYGSSKTESVYTRYIASCTVAVDYVPRFLLRFFRRWPVSFGSIVNVTDCGNRGVTARSRARSFSPRLTTANRRSGSVPFNVREKARRTLGDSQ